MYLLILALPLISFFLNSLLGRYLGRFLGVTFSLISSFLSFVFACIIFYEIFLSQAVVSIQIYNWIETNNSIFTIGLLYDSLTSIMLLVITIISFFVQLYSVDYMSHDPHLNRFFSYLSLFTFFMLLLVTSDNFLQLFLGWEGVGVCSYLLINFWFTRTLANKAALKAMIMNRIADVFFIISILIFFLYFNTLNYVVLFSLIPFYVDYKITFLGLNLNILDIIGFFLCIGAIGKSAQIGLHTWLPDAMEGPTPVSSLLHAATMVTAGIFLIIRCSPIIEYSESTLLIIAVFGGLTAFFSAIIGVFQYDVKKVIAYSTVVN